jgi:hypothetical protein
MSIFVGDHHLLDDLLEILISYLNNTIHLGFVRRRLGVYNRPLGAEFNNYFPIKVLSIISYQSYWQAIPTN